eukprot:6188505-Pleurochrysis_carterae.AAC.3
MNTKSTPFKPYRERAMEAAGAAFSPHAVHGTLLCDDPEAASSSQQVPQYASTHHAMVLDRTFHEKDASELAGKMSLHLSFKSDVCIHYTFGPKKASMLLADINPESAAHNPHTQRALQAELT